MHLSSDAAAACRKHQVLMTAIWGGMIASTLVYGAVLQFLGGGLSTDLAIFLASPVVALLLGAAGLSFTAAWILPKLLVGSPIKLEEATTESKRIQVALGRLAVAKIVQFAMIEAGALTGFAAGLITRNFMPYLITCSVGLVAFAIHRPVPSEAEEALRRL